jgi:hypothetical protein
LKIVSNNKNQIGKHYTSYLKKRNMVTAWGAKKHNCIVCGTEVTKDEYDDHEGLCRECWNDQLTEESNSMFDELM